MTLYAASVLFPLFAFPAWILDIPAMIWQFSQPNIAGGSLILWIIMTNFFNSVNSLIWPRDNLDQWWDGNVWCDIHTHVQIGSGVALAACVTMIMRRLARVMDTRNITVGSSRNIQVKETFLEIFWCWGYPAILTSVYYVIQPIRYFIFGITGCSAAYDPSWPSVVLGFMWAPITMCFATYYSGLLVFRLYRYRREFNNLVAARDTTKSRFMRLFIMSMIIMVVYLPYQFYILSTMASKIMENMPYDWDRVHGPGWNVVIKVPSFGSVKFDKWGQVCSGYLAFLIFSTGSDARKAYKRILCSIGLGRIFPSLLPRHNGHGSAPYSSSFMQSWTSTLSTKAKGLFSKHDSVTDTMDTVALSSMPSALPPLSTEATTSSEQPILRNEPNPLPTGREHTIADVVVFSAACFFGPTREEPAAPIEFQAPTTDNASEESPVDSIFHGVQTRAWASDNPHDRENEGLSGVLVTHEVEVEYHDADQSNDDKEDGEYKELWARDYP